jgi:hypothetical protein
MTAHHPQSAAPPPTARQQRYLRQLALQRGISFVPPRTRFEASRLIDQLKRRAPDPVADRRREIRAVQDDMARRGGDARVIEGVETSGYGSSATWKGRPVVTAPIVIETRRVGETNAPVELARYTVSAGERVIYGQRVLGVVRLIDEPALGDGRRYVIERELTVMAELEAIVADYLDQAARWQGIPAAGPAIWPTAPRSCWHDRPTRSPVSTAPA